jgi:hypothetical protein
MAKFKKGESGNPKGRAKGSRHKATLAALELLEGDLEAITQKCIDKAKNGDLIAVKLILDKVLPNARERPISFKFPKVEGAADIITAFAAILEAVALGEITPGEARELAGIIEAVRKGIELVDLEARLTRIEEKIK